METEIRTTAEPKLQLAVLRCPGYSAATGRRVRRVWQDLRVTTG